ncbi:MAG: acyltransferase family protein [Verrucomicrobiales bacterium]
MARPASQYNIFFESMRGIAAFMVLMAHMCPFGFGTVPLAISQVGVLGVNIFFTLSGFLIARCVLGPSSFSGSVYLRSRSYRILPSYFICMIFALLVADARPLMHDSAWGQLGNLLSHITLTHGWFDKYHVSIVGPFWTLSHEWWFYIFMLAAAGLIRSGRWGWVVAGMIVVAFVSRLGQAERWWSLDPKLLHPLCLLDQFAFGIAAAALAGRYGQGWADRRWVVPVLLVAGLGLTSWWIYSYYHLVSGINPLKYHGIMFGERVRELLFKSRSHVLWFGPGLAAGLAMLLTALWLMPRSWGNWLRFTPLPGMGKVSYSTYLWHAPLLLCLMRGVRNMPPESPWSEPWPRFWLAFAIIYGFSAFAYQFFELPWLRSQRGTASGAAAP